MDNRLFEEKLTEFKADERAEVVLLLGNDADLLRITVAWTNMATSPAKKETRPPKVNNATAWWNWLWDNTTYSRQELMEKAHQSYQDFDQKVKALIGNRILYPDGSINSFAQRYLRERVLKLFQAKPPTLRTKPAKARPARCNLSHIENGSLPDELH